MTKVLHVIQSMTGGGAARALAATSRESSKLGLFEHRVASLQPAAQGGLDLARAAGIPVLNAPTRPDLARALAETDITQIHFWNNPEIHELFRSDLPPLRLLMWFHIAGDKPPQILTSRAVDFADFALACSPYTYERPALRSLPAAERAARTGMVYGAADFEPLAHFKPRPHPHFNVGYIGTVDFIKMHPRYVPMSAGANIPDARFIVCGGGIEAQLRQQAADLGAGERFEFRGYVEHIRSVLEILDVYGYPLCPDTYAASELNLQEAMYCGVPPVVFPYGGVKRLVRHGETGLIVESEEEYQAALESLYRNPAERERLGRNARAYASEHFGAVNAAQAINPIYARMMERPKQTRVWGCRAGTPILAQPVTLEDLVVPTPGTRAGRWFIESLGEAGQVFEISMTGADLSSTLQADEAIAESSVLLRSPGAGGIFHYRSRYPEDAWLRFWSGLVLQRFGDVRQTIAEYTAAIRLGFSHWRIHWRLAQAYEKMGDTASAAASRKIVSQAAPNFAEARAVLELQRERSAQPKTGASFLERANDLFAQGQLGAAAEALNQAIQLEPGNVEWILAHGNILFQLDRLEEARAGYSKAAQLRPGNPDILARLALVCLRLGRIAEWEASLTEALQQDENHRPSLKHLGDMNFQNGRLAEAIVIYQRLLAAEPEETEVLLPLGVCLYKSRDLQLAGETFERVLRLQPRHELARQNLRLIREKLSGGRSASAGAATTEENEPLVSAIVSTYNAEEFMRGCLQDLVEQTLFKKGLLEIVVMDSGSPQNERKIVESFQRTYPQIRYTSTERETLYAAWNRGIRQARGKYITSANTDDRHRSDALEIMARVLSEQNAGVVYSDVLLTTVANETHNETVSTLVWQLPDYSLRQSLMHCPFGSKYMWPRSAHDDAGWFDPSLTIAGDYEFFFRLARRRGALRIADALGLYYESMKNLSYGDQQKVVIEVHSFIDRYRAEVALEEVYPFLSADHSPIARAAALVDLGNQLAWRSVYPGWAAAERCYREALALPGTPVEIQCNLALLWFQQGRKEEAQRLFQELSASHPRQVESLLKSNARMVSIPYPALAAMPEAVTPQGRRIPRANYRGAMPAGLPASFGQ